MDTLQVLPVLLPFSLWGHVVGRAQSISEMKTGRGRGKWGWSGGAWGFAKQEHTHLSFTKKIFFLSFKALVSSREKLLFVYEENVLF